MKNRRRNMKEQKQPSAKQVAKQQKALEKQQQKALRKQQKLDKKHKENKHSRKTVVERAKRIRLFALEKEKNSVENTILALAKKQGDNKKWYKLDNAALMYPLVASRESISIFRLAVQLKQPVDPVKLQLAVNDIYTRFPTMCGSVKYGWFWPYIDKPATPIIVKKQTKVPGRPMKVDTKRSQIRVNYFQNQIAVEFFHSATDGTGGLIFLNSLLRCYFRHVGIETEKVNCYDHRDVPDLSEIRDNFANIAVAKNPPPCPPVVPSKVINGTFAKNKRYVTVRGVCSASQLHQIAKQHNATITEFLGAVQLLALNRLAQVTNTKDERPIRVLVPVNLRKIYNVETVRNFSSYIFYQYNGQQNLDEVIADIKAQAKEQLTDDYFRGMVSYNYNSGNMPILKIVPLALKKLVLKAIVKNRGDGIVNCSSLSNLGVVKAPKEFAEHVVRYEFMLGKPTKKTNNFTVATYNDVCVISITNIFAEKDCEKFFFTTLQQLGVDLAVESDIWEDVQ